jgi:dimethylamine/trimethylamine dehydrogenase
MERGVTITSIETGIVRGETEFEEAWSRDADAVVLVTQQVSDDDLYRDLTSDPAALEAGGITAVFRIGDAVAPRFISEAVFDGHRLAREIDGPDPATPRPYDRERNLPDVAPSITR